MQPPRASAGTGWGVYLQGTPMPKSVRVLAGGKWWKLDVIPPCVAPSRVSSRGVSEVDTVPCQLLRSASELQGCPTSRNSSYIGREVVLRGLGLQSWVYWLQCTICSLSAVSLSYSSATSCSSGICNGGGLEVRDLVLRVGLIIELREIGKRVGLSLSSPQSELYGNQGTNRIFKESKVSLEEMLRKVDAQNPYEILNFHRQVHRIRIVSKLGLRGLNHVGSTPLLGFGVDWAACGAGLTPLLERGAVIGLLSCSNHAVTWF
ncbi:hypothetical protein PIB30_006639 [Stylosanthes scabra]|uniref:Uncharacterized protein n=1 Tax=Stylosanthes scabra TaxID=79078 RepID=A0ABU6Q4H7_9FABA|nr:hypothetical protein [Stylosanthes scabra]